jgi:hypothetical protein
VRLRRGELPVGDLFGRRLQRLALLTPIRVDIGVREDAVQPGLEVGALFELVEGGVRLQERLLHQVLGVGRVTRHSQARGIKLVNERQRVPLETRPALLGPFCLNHPVLSPRQPRRGYG